MQPRSVRAEQHLVRAGTLHGIHEQVEPPHARRVRVHVAMSYEMVDERQLRTPVIRETAKVRDDERDVRIFCGDELDLRDLTHDVVQHRNAIRTRDLAHLTRDRRVVTVNLDPAKSIARYCLADERAHTPGVARGMHERETEKPPPIR